MKGDILCTELCRWRMVVELRLGSCFVGRESSQDREFIYSSLLLNIQEDEALVEVVG